MQLLTWQRTLYSTKTSYSLRSPLHISQCGKHFIEMNRIPTIALLSIASTLQGGGNRLFMGWSRQLRSHILLWKYVFLSPGASLVLSHHLLLPLLPPFSSTSFFLFLCCPSPLLFCLLTLFSFSFLWAGEGNRTTIRAVHSIFLSVLNFYLSALKSVQPCDWLGQWNVNCHASLLNRMLKTRCMIFQIFFQYLQVYMLLKYLLNLNCLVSRLADLSPQICSGCVHKGNLSSLHMSAVIQFVCFSVWYLV